MLFTGVLLAALGISGELILGTKFEEFFSVSYPYSTERWDDFRLKVRLNRLMFVIGLGLTVLGLLDLVLD